LIGLIRKVKGHGVKRLKAGRPENWKAEMLGSWEAGRIEK